MSRLPRILEDLRGGRPLDLGDLHPADGVLSAVLEAAPKIDDHKHLPTINLAGAVFEERVEFYNVVFDGFGNFGHVSFEQKLRFVHCRFHEAVWFEKARFADGVVFIDTEFASWVEFDSASFVGDEAEFDEARFEKSVHFRDTTFEDGASFEGAKFGGLVDLRGARFHDASFANADFKVDVDVAAMEVSDVVTFEGATFHGSGLRGWLEAHQALNFDGTTFLNVVDIAIAAPRISCTYSQFREGGRFTIGGGEVDLEGASFGRPLVLSGAAEEETMNRSRPRIVSLRWADLRNLVLSGVDMRCCRFIGGHNLNNLRIEGDVGIADPPEGNGIRLWTPRRILAEEHQWRAARPSRQDQYGPAPAAWLFHGSRIRGWYPVSTQPPPWSIEKHPELTGPSAARYIANVYRDLRRARENAGDEPGAADFFYGEMEMRRFDRERPWAERASLFLYWLVSGYGLRATRALAALVVTIVGFAVLLWRFGFDPTPHHAAPDFARALLFSAESTSNLFRTPRTPHFELTAWGEAMQIPLRLLGPFFFGLALFSLRGRVKR